MKLMSKNQLSTISKIEVRGSHFYVRKIARPGYEPIPATQTDEVKECFFLSEDKKVIQSDGDVMVEVADGVFTTLDKRVIQDLVKYISGQPENLSLKPDDIVPTDKKVVVETGDGILMVLDHDVVQDLILNVICVRILDNETDLINYCKPVFSDGEKTCYTINQLCLQIIKYTLFKKIYSGPNQAIENKVEIHYSNAADSELFKRLGKATVTFDELISGLKIHSTISMSTSSGEIRR